MAIISFFALFLSLLGRCYAGVILYVPDTDPQALSASELGTDLNGRTSWLISPATPTGSEPPSDPGPAFVIVEGPTDVIIPTQTFLLTDEPGQTTTEILYNSCAIAPDGTSTCHVSLNMIGPQIGPSIQAAGTIGVFTELAQTFELQGGPTTPPPAPTPSIPSAPAPVSAPPQNSPTPIPTSDAGPNITPILGTTLPTTSPSTAHSIHPTRYILVLIALLFYSIS